MPIYSVFKEYYLLFVVWGLLFFGLKCEGFFFGYPKPPNCVKYECPEYDVIYSETRFEIRVYKKAKWIAFPLNDSNSFKDASTRGFLLLFDYINGNNMDGTNISITAPILIDIGTPTGSSPYIVNFYIPKKYQDNPPLPISDLYRPVELPPKKFAAVRRFGGFSSDKNIPKQASDLKRYLKKTPWRSASLVEVYSQAGYNPPYQLTNRVNEIVIWFD